MTTRTCSIPNCNAIHFAKGLCRRHYSAEYARQRRKSKTAPRCNVAGCERPSTSLGYCDMHYQRVRKTGRAGAAESGRIPQGKCRMPGCDRQSRTIGYCELHYGRIRRHGDPYTKLTNKGQGWKIESGYKILHLPGHPNARKSGYVAEHIAIVAERLGRPLHKHETVHHINGVRDDNRPENLELWASKHPSGQRVSDLVAWAHEIIALYDEPEFYTYEVNLADVWSMEQRNDAT